MNDSLSLLRPGSYHISGSHHFNGRAWSLQKSSLWQEGSGFGFLVPHSLQLLSELSAIQLGSENTLILGQEGLRQLSCSRWSQAARLLLLKTILCLRVIDDVQHIQASVCDVVLLSCVERFPTKSSKKGYYIHSAVFFQLFGNHPI